MSAPIVKTFFDPHLGATYRGAVSPPPMAFVNIAAALNGLTLDVQVAASLIRARAHVLKLGDVRVHEDCITLLSGPIDKDSTVHSWRIIRFKDPA